MPRADKSSLDVVLMIVTNKLEWELPRESGLTRMASSVLFLGPPISLMELLDRGGVSMSSMVCRTASMMVRRSNG